MRAHSNVQISKSTINPKKELDDVISLEEQMKNAPQTTGARLPHQNQSRVSSTYSRRRNWPHVLLICHLRCRLACYQYKIWRRNANCARVCLPHCPGFSHRAKGSQHMQHHWKYHFFDSKAKSMTHVFSLLVVSLSWSQLCSLDNLSQNVSMCLLACHHGEIGSRFVVM